MNKVPLSLRKRTLTKKIPHSHEASPKPPDPFGIGLKRFSVRQRLQIPTEILEDESPRLFKERILGLEAVGVFFDSQNTKQKRIPISSEQLNLRNKLIHITDFMAKDQKMKMLRTIAIFDGYLPKKSEFQQEPANKPENNPNFFNSLNKFSEFFNTLPATPGHKDLKKINEKDFPRNHKSLIKIDNLIQKCRLALLNKPCNHDAMPSKALIKLTKSKK
jgi:hypothetical protein